MEFPSPCYYCRVMSRHDCRMQPVCAKVRRWHKSRLESELVEYSIRKGERIERRMR